MSTTTSIITICEELSLKYRKETKYDDLASHANGYYKIVKDHVN